MRPKTFTSNKEVAERNWRIVDANGQILGRMASKIAVVLRGKDKPIFTPHVDTGDFVVVINAEKVALTGNKWNDKMYHTYSGYRGGLKTKSAKQMVEEDSEEMIRLAVWGMLPKGPLGRQIILKLKVYKGNIHPHEAQNPVPLAVS